MDRGQPMTIPQNRARPLHPPPAPPLGTAARPPGPLPPPPLALGRARPVETAAGARAPVPLVLVDILTEEGIPGRSYVRCSTPMALRPLAALLANVGELLVGERAAPAPVEQKLQQHFRLL